MVPHIQRKAAIVTGASRGIGRACAVRLAQDGFSVVVGYVSGRAEADETVAAIKSTGSDAAAVGADVADEAAAVVNAAGTMSLAPLADFDLAVLDDMLRTNVRGTFVVAQQAARRLRAGGSIINFSSSVIGRVLPNYTGYAASKGAVEAMTFILAHELRGRDINVNAVAPGPTATEMFLDGKTAEQVESFAKAAPLERLGTPQDTAEAVAFLASPAGHWVNGQAIRVNGGVI